MAFMVTDDSHDDRRFMGAVVFDVLKDQGCLNYPKGAVCLC